MASLLQGIDEKTVIAFVLGLVAAAVGIGLQSRAEHRHWLRQQRLDAFSAFVAGLDSMYRPAVLWQFSWGEPEEDANRSAYLDRMEALDRLGGRIHLLSNPAVNRAAVDALGDWMIEANRALRTQDAARLDRAESAAAGHYRTFIELARQELRQPRAFLKKEDFDALEGDRAKLRETVEKPKG